MEENTEKKPKEKKIKTSRVLDQIRNEIFERMKVPEYQRDVDVLTDTYKQELRDDKGLDLLQKIFAFNSLDLPKSKHKGLKGKAMNSFIVKIYHVVKKMFERYFLTQTMIDDILIHELAEIKQNIKIKPRSTFPFEDFEDYLELQSKDDINEKLKNAIKQSKSILDIGCLSGRIVNQALEDNVDEIYAVTRRKKVESQFLETKANVENQSLAKYLNNMDKKFELIVINEILHYYDLDFCIEILRSAYRLLNDNGQVFVKIKGSSYDPRTIQIIDPQMAKFMFEYAGFTLEDNFKDNVIWLKK